ncbi:MAG: choice-of-anchor tandem repeat GloVer-containing protein [Terriglobales bacterium]|jgi:uncharacterized repeat protein (TIGR03803 family)
MQMVSVRTAVKASLALAIIIGCNFSSAQTLTILHTFSGLSGDGAYPYAGLVRDAAGNLYGTTEGGGASLACLNGCGTIFRIDSSGNEKILYNFGQTRASGANPYYGALYPDAAGNLYGTTQDGGTAGNGTLFRISPKGAFASLSLAGGAEGGFPYAGLISDGKGNFYGTTYLRGTGCAPFGCGTVFKIDKTGKETVLYNFMGGGDGQNPSAGLTIDSDGNLYGTTQYGGGNEFCVPGCGTIFKIDPSGHETILFAFPQLYETGWPSPGGSLIRDSAGNLYGTTTLAPGDIFKLEPSGAFDILYTFQYNNADGYFPYGGLEQDAQGNFYGTTVEGGAYGLGTIYELDTTGKEHVLYSFAGFGDGGAPFGGLVLDSQGNLYGTTSGMSGFGFPGVAFKFTP